MTPPPGQKHPASAGFSAFNLADASERIVSGRLPGLEFLGEKIGKSSTRKYFEFLGCLPEINVGQTKRERFSDFLGSGKGDVFCVFSCRGNKFLVSISSGLLNAANDAIFGGKGLFEKNNGRLPSTSLDSSTAGKFGNIFASEFSSALWENEAGFERCETDGKFLFDIATGTEASYSIAIRMDINGTTGTIRIFFPSGTLAGVDKDLSNAVGDREQTDAERTRMEKNIRNTVVNARVVLGTKQVTLREIYAMIPGDILLFESDPHLTVNGIRIEDIDIIDGKPVVKGKP